MVVLVVVGKLATILKVLASYITLFITNIFEKMMQKTEILVTAWIVRESLKAENASGELRL